MLSDRKQFSGLDAEWSTRAERDLRAWLRGHGYQWNHLPNGQYGIDGKVFNDFEEFYVEVERRKPSTKGWTDGNFPFPTVDIPIRRRPSVEKKCLFFTFRADARAAIVVFPDSIRDDRTKYKSTSVTRNEKFYYVPTAEVLPIDLLEISGPTLADMNADRVRKAVRSGNISYGKACRGDQPPYGITVEEWMEMGDELEKPLVEQFCIHDHRRRDKDIHGRQGWFSEFCTDCGKWYGNGPLPRKQEPTT